MAQKSMAFSVGSIRAKESTLLDQQDLEQLLHAGSEEELLRLLRDKGYGSDMGQEQDTEALLAAERRRLWEEVLALAADPALFDLFRVKQDFHNCRAIVKGILGNRPYAHLLLPDGRAAPEQIEAAVKEQRFATLPDFLRAPVQRAYTLLSETGDPQLSDACLDQAELTCRLCLAAASGKPLLAEYMRAVVFYADVKIALRAARAGKSRTFLEQALVCGDGLPTQQLLTAALSGEDEVLALLASFEQFGGAGAAEQYKKSPALFEKYADDYALRIAARARRITLGEEVLVGYYLAKEAELGAVQMIAVGVRTGQPPEEIRERLRVLYG